MVSGHSQSLKLTGLGKYLPLTHQYQVRLNYKWRVYTAHMKGAPQVRSLLIGKAVPLDPIGHLLYSATLPRHMVKEAPLNT